MGLATETRLTEVGALPADWFVKPCAELSDLITVGIVVRPTQYYVPEGVPALRSANIREGWINRQDLVHISARANGLLAKSQVRSGDVLTVRTGYPGTSAVVPGDLEGANCIDILITRPSRAVNSQYLCAWINSSHGKLQVLRDQGGLAQQHFNVGDLRNLKVALPPTVKEQEAIAGALSDADALIASLEQLLVKKRHLKQGAMQELLTGKKRLPGYTHPWLAKRLGDLGCFSKGRGVSKSESTSGPLPCVRYGEIYTRHNNFIREFYSRISSGVAATATRLQCGDILFAGSGETKEEIGKCVAFVDQFEAYAGGDIVILRTVDADPHFLGYYLNTLEINRQKASRGQGDAVVHIGAAALAEIRGSFPPPKEQAAIAKVLVDMDSEIAALEAKLTKVRQIKQGMMQELLTGRIRLV